ncbi:hypothetical protein GALL_520580 [mine drainage metagenome]|uniref:Uncharacterized protein n=1 Tax=mine drainage metagenome TaxID=410659 RepID=A0A1J5PS25_9ZZZZ
MQPFGQIAKQRRRDREVEGAHHTLAHQTGELGPAVFAGGVDRDVSEARQKFGDDRGVLFVFGNKLGNRGADKGAVAFVGHLGAGGANDAAFLGHLARAESNIEAGQDLAPGKIAGAAEHNKVKDIHRNHARNHHSPFRLAITSPLALTGTF